MRPVLSVIITFVVMSMLVLALGLTPWYILGIDTVLQPGLLDSRAMFAVYAVLVGILERWLPAGSAPG